MVILIFPYSYHGGQNYLPDPRVVKFAKVKESWDFHGKIPLQKPTLVLSTQKNSFYGQNYPGSGGMTPRNHHQLAIRDVSVLLYLRLHDLKVFALQNKRTANTSGLCGFNFQRFLLKCQCVKSYHQRHIIIIYHYLNALFQSILRRFVNSIAEFNFQGFFRKQVPGEQSTRLYGTFLISYQIYFCPTSLYM